MVSLIQSPTDGEQHFQLTPLRKLAFDVGDEFRPLLVHLVLRLEERAALFVPLGFEGFDLLLAGELFLQRQGCGGGAAGFLDLAIHLLDLAFQAEFEVVGPAVEFFCLGFKKSGVALRNRAPDGGLPLLDDFTDGAGCDAQTGTGDFSR